MSSDLISNLQLDTEETNKIITVKEINNCDSSFILSCVLNHSFKSKNGVVIVSTHNSLLHYQQVGLMMNYSLQKHIDSGLVAFYNLGEQITNGLFLNQVSSLRQQYIKIKELMNKLLETNKTVNIILDGVSHLFDLGYTLQDVNLFCSDVIKLSRSINNSFLFFHCNIASDDDVTSMMGSLLSHKSHTIVEVENLPSGWSADVSGHLNIKRPHMKFVTEHMFNFDQKSVKYLFKLFSRGVKLFAPGTV